jgi:hypothetical protein
MDLAAPFADTATGAQPAGAVAGSLSVNVGPARLLVTAPVAALAGVATTFTVSAVDEASQVIPGYRGAIHLTSTDSAAALLADYTFTATDAGTHTFDITFNTAPGRWAVTARDVNGPALGTPGAISGSGRRTVVIRLPFGNPGPGGGAFLINQGLLLQMLGNTVPGALIKIIIHSDPIEIDTTADAQGNWNVTFDSTQIDWGDHTVFYREIDPDGTDTGLFAVGKLTIVDVTPPTSTAVRVPDVPWTNHTVTVTVTAVDQPHGSQVKEIHLVLDGGAEQVFAGALATAVFSAEGLHHLDYWAVDNAGNVEARKTMTGINIDLTPPVVTIGGVIDGGDYVLGQPPTPTFTASDALSGIATSSAATTPPATASGAGTYVYTATAADRAGNVTTVQATWRLLYRFQGFLSPRAFQHVEEREPLTVSFRLCDVNNTLVKNGAARLTVDGNPATPAGRFNTGDAFRFRGTEQDDEDGHRRPATCPGHGHGGEGDEGEGGGIYLYRLSTARLAAGNHLLTALLDDGTQEQIMITVFVEQDQQGEHEGEDRRPVYTRFGALTATPNPAIQLGQAIALSGSGFASGAAVRLNFGAYLAKVVTSADGTLAAMITPPVFDLAGLYQITATGLAADGKTLVLSARVWYGPLPPPDQDDRDEGSHHTESHDRSSPAPLRGFSLPLERLRGRTFLPPRFSRDH